MKKIKILFAVAAFFALCLCLSACSTPTKVEEIQAEGKVLSVRFEANGGKYHGREGITIMDMFDPNDYAATKDAEGNVQIKLTDPTDPIRVTAGAQKNDLTRTGYFYVGWYKNRTVKTDANQNPIDDAGNRLYEKEGKYYSDEACNNEVTPAYNYSEPWNFETDRLSYKLGDTEPKQLTLYAGWVKFFEFNYYVQENGTWKKLDTVTTFDYVTANSDAFNAKDTDTIWMPAWPTELGAMNYSYKYQNGTAYSFPQIPGTTFEKAYTDEACTQPIEGSLEHKGSIDLATATAIDPVQNVYITTTPGEQYKIKTPEQLIQYANINGHYEIMNDLDFGELKDADGKVTRQALAWPNAFMTGDFHGSLKSTEGQSFKLSNITATLSSTNLQNGGLFGRLAADAVMKDIAFENVTLDVANVSSRMSAVNIGLFVGYIDDGATLTNVTVGKATMRVGALSLAPDKVEIHLIANGNNAALIAGRTEDKIALIVYADTSMKAYNGNYIIFSVDYENVTVENLDVTLPLASLSKAAATVESDQLIGSY